MFTRTELYISNRIALLEHRQKDNKRIIQKLQRKLKQIREKEESNDSNS